MAMILIIVTTLFVFIGSLHKKIADKHNHPQADAINAASWLTLFMEASNRLSHWFGRTPNLAMQVTAVQPTTV